MADSTPPKPASETVPPVTKVTFNLPTDLFMQIEELSSKTGRTKTDVLQQMLKLGIFVKQESQKGQKLLLEDDSTKQMRQVFFT